MPSSEIRRPRQHDVGAEYSYRRPLRLREMLPAIGIGIGVGVFTYYVTRLLLQRTPMRRPVSTELRVPKRERSDLR